MAMNFIRARHLWRTEMLNGKEVPVRREFTEYAWKHMLRTVHPDTGEYHPKEGFVKDGTDPSKAPPEVREAEANAKAKRRKRVSK